MKPIKSEGNNPISESEMNHPAFGQIRASRVHGGHGVLYDSDFKHHHFINLEITGSKLFRTLSNDWHHATGSKIEITMTEAQWATFVSSLNFGSGTPCTIERFNGERIPPIEWEETKAEVFQEEFDDRMKEAQATLSQLEKMLDDTKLSKKARDELKSMVSRARANIGSNLKFTSDQFGEHMEKTVERAKQEIHGHATGVAMSVGIEKLREDGSSDQVLLPPGMKS